MSCLLALETAAGACSVALAIDGEIVSRCEERERGHAERLLPMTLALLADTDIAFAALDAVAVTVGPGAFTGLRIGLAAARGIALALARPCFGVTTFEAIAEAVAAERAGAGGSGPAELPLLVVLNTKRRDFYGQWIAAGGAAMAPPGIADAGGWAAQCVGRASILLAGDGAPAVAEVLTAAGGGEGTVIAGCRTPNAAAVARLAMRRWDAGERPALPPAPLYLRAAETGPPRYASIVPC